MNLSLKEIAEKLKTAKSVAIFSHTRPDGDAYGSSLALSRALEGLGVRTCVCNDSDLPSNLVRDSYRTLINIYEEAPELSEDEKQLILHDNAETAYFS